MEKKRYIAPNQRVVSYENCNSLCGVSGTEGLDGNNPTIGKPDDPDDPDPDWGGVKEERFGDQAIWDKEW